MDDLLWGGDDVDSNGLVDRPCMTDDKRVVLSTIERDIHVFCVIEGERDVSLPFLIVLAYLLNTDSFCDSLVAISSKADCDFSIGFI